MFFRIKHQQFCIEKRFQMPRQKPEYDADDEDEVDVPEPEDPMISTFLFFKTKKTHNFPKFQSNRMILTSFRW